MLFCSSKCGAVVEVQGRSGEILGEGQVKLEVPAEGKCQLLRHMPALCLWQLCTHHPGTGRGSESVLCTRPPMPSIGLPDS